MIVALLLGRKGSIGFPGKNLYPVLGRPLASSLLRGKRILCHYLTTRRNIPPVFMI